MLLLVVWFSLAWFGLVWDFFPHWSCLLNTCGKTQRPEVSRPLSAPSVCRTCMVTLKSHVWQLMGNHSLVGSLEWYEESYKTVSALGAFTLLYTTAERLKDPKQTRACSSFGDVKSCGLRSTNVSGYKYSTECSSSLSQNLNAVRFHPNEWFFK